MMLEKFGQDVYNHVSLPSMAFAYLNNQGCYDECFAMSGAVLAFVREAIVGGRCMTRDNQKHHFVSRTYEEDGEVKTNVVLDSDVNSLYPAAMARLEGFAKGKPKFFQISKTEKQILRIKEQRLSVRTLVNHKSLTL
ncbi:hypothetical protein L914_01167 [Phytophthora nicotianae]|uniref:DNA-directed DNA polymerase n=1 Tax=Phytophthora nicotianae TaxID=4792 RepID=W2P3T0_PHYNI|nr:hypothetical protein L914_01167 [Phytophthora nicotianae]